MRPGGRGRNGARRAGPRRGRPARPDLRPRGAGLSGDRADRPGQRDRPGRAEPAADLLAGYGVDVGRDTTGCAAVRPVDVRPLRRAAVLEAVLGSGPAAAVVRPGRRAVEPDNEEAPGTPSSGCAAATWPQSRPWAGYSAAGPALTAHSTPPRAPVHRRGESHRAGRGLLLRLDGHWPWGPPWQPPGRHRARRGRPAPLRRRRGQRRGRAGTGPGAARPAHPAARSEARQAVADAAGCMGREMPATDLRDLLRASRDSDQWEEVVKRRLTCGNCTMACSTCFCTSTEDVTDLTGDHAERWQHWAPASSSISPTGTAAARASPGPAGTGSVPPTSWAPGTISSALWMCRLWGVHRLVPVGIDITEETTALARDAGEADGGVTTTGADLEDPGALERLSPGERDQVLSTASEVTYRARERLFLADQPAQGAGSFAPGTWPSTCRFPAAARRWSDRRRRRRGGMAWRIPPCRWQFGARAVDDDTAGAARHRPAEGHGRPGSRAWVRAGPDPLPGGH